MTILTDSDRAECDDFLHRVHRQSDAPAAWDESAPFTQEEASSWFTAALYIGVAFALLAFTALAIAPHLP